MFPNFFFLQVWSRMEILTATWEKLLFMSFADFNPPCKISLWLPQIISKFSQLMEECVAIFCDSESWAKGQPGLEAFWFCDRPFLQFLPSKSMNVWLCHHRCTRIYSINCFHSERHKGLFLLVIPNSHEYLRKNVFTVFPLLLCFSAHCCQESAAS